MINKDVVKALAVQSGAAVGVITHFTPDELLVFANAIAAARRVVADTLAAEPKLCITEKPRGCATPRACSALAQIDDLGMRIESLVWATVLPLNKALADDDKEN